jgi:hypothetical protein
MTPRFTAFEKSEIHFNLFTQFLLVRKVSTLAGPIRENNQMHCLTS